MSNIVESATHVLTYKGRVDPPAGSVMGPGLDGRRWQVLGSEYDVASQTSSVTVEVAA